jgi:hypothetical protein
MRKAAGILLILYGELSLFVFGVVLFTHLHIFVFGPFDTLFIISAAFTVTGGVFYLKRNYWKLCFASALFAVLMMIFLMLGIVEFPEILWLPCFSPLLQPWWAWPFIITWALPIIFVCIKKREWSESQA